MYNSDSPLSPDATNEIVEFQQNGKWEVRYTTNLMQIWVRDESLVFDSEGQRKVEDNGWIECRWVLADYATIPFGIDMVKAIRRDMSKKPTDKEVLRRASRFIVNCSAAHRNRNLDRFPVPKRRPGAPTSRDKKGSPPAEVVARTKRRHSDTAGCSAYARTR